MHRPTIADLARAAGVSVSTVDRVINGRDPVRKATAERVLKAAQEIGYYGAELIGQRLAPATPDKTFGFLLLQKQRPFYQRLGEALTAATRECGLVVGSSRVVYLDEIEPLKAAEHIDRLGRTCDAIAIVAANQPPVLAAVERVQQRGVPVFGLISELAMSGPIGYAGLDNWKVGRSAAWALANMCPRPAKLAVLVGSHRFRCQDLNEIGFRSFVREHAAEIEVIDAGASLEESRLAKELTLHLLQRHPDLTGLYVAGGGIRGVLEALKESGAQGRVVTVCNDLTVVTRAGLAEGLIKLVIAHPVQTLATALVKAMAQATIARGTVTLAKVNLPFDLFTSENV